MRGSNTRAPAAASFRPNLGITLPYLSQHSRDLRRKLACDPCPLGAGPGARVSAGLALAADGNLWAASDNFFSKTFRGGRLPERLPWGVSIPTNPFIDNNLIQMEANLYFIQLDLVLIPPQQCRHQRNDRSDIFSTSALGGKFIFSPGVVSQVPLPAAFPLLPPASAPWCVWLAQEGQAAVPRPARDR